MKISCIMANYNTKEEYLTKSINSILNQTYKDFELIIVDDGSTNGNVEFLQEYKNKDNRIKLLINDKNMGQPYSRNRAIKTASGEYIAIMDADDISLKDRFKIEVDYLDSHKEIMAVGGHKNDWSGDQLCLWSF